MRGGGGSRQTIPRVMESRESGWLAPLGLRFLLFPFQHGAVRQVKPWIKHRGSMDTAIKDSWGQARGERDALGKKEPG